MKRENKAIVFCFILLISNIAIAMKREQHTSQKMSPAAKADRDAIVRDPDAAQMLTKSMPAVRRLNLSGTTETAGQSSSSVVAPHSPIRKTVSLDPEVLEREEDKLRRSQHNSTVNPSLGPLSPAATNTVPCVSLSLATSPRYQFPFEVSKLHDWATKHGRYKSSHIGNIAGERALIQTYSVDALDKEWFTPLMGAILRDDRGDNLDRVEFLVRNGARIDRICMLGLDPLQLCKPDSEAIRALLIRRAEELKISFSKNRYGPDITITLNKKGYEELPDSIKTELSELRSVAESANASAQAIVAYKFLLLKCGLIDGIHTTACSVWQPKQKEQKKEEQKK